MIVCANLANLLLARAVNRVRETAIRMAIGATRWQVIRQFLTESLLLSFAGGSLGLGIAVMAVRFLSSISDAIRISARLPFWITVSVDYHVYLYLIAVCFVTGVLFGLTPALQIARTHAGDRLKDGSNAAGISIRTSRLTAVLVTSEIALTLTLLVAAGLMIRSVVRFQAFDTDPNAVYASLVLAPPKYANPASRVLFMGSLIGELEGRLGARAITAATGVAGNVTWREIETDQKPLPETATLVVIPGYFNTLSVPILHGRDFDDADGRPERSVAIVNQQFASQHWFGEDPIGKRIRKTTPAGGPWLTVIGVVGNQQVEDSEAPQPVVYTPYRQEPSPSLVLTARSQLPRDEVAGVLRAEVQKADPDLPLFNVMTKQEYLAQLGVPIRLFAWMFGAFAVLAFVMSLIGIYGVTAYSVAQRTREIGIRVTLGASGHSVLWLVLKQGFRRLLIGLLLGFGGALAISRALAGMLFHTAPTDVATYVIIVLLFAGTTIAACVIPARHAMKVDPARSLRL
jgi:predicted permease